MSDDYIHRRINEILHDKISMGAGEHNYDDMEYVGAGGKPLGYDGYKKYYLKRNPNATLIDVHESYIGRIKDSRYSKVEKEKIIKRHQAMLKRLKKPGTQVKKAPVKRVAVKRVPVKKTVARKPAIKKSAVRKAPVKKTVVRKAPVKKTVARKPAVRKAPGEQSLWIPLKNKYMKKGNGQLPLSEISRMYRLMLQGYSENEAYNAIIHGTGYY